MNLPTYFARCAAHDWLYQYSDDHSVYLAGSAERKALAFAALGSEVFTAVFNAWAAFWLSPPKDRGPRPELSSFDPDEQDGQLSILDPR